ncbi:MAG TPA: CDGSH iron-sulfur domain-containing protein [Candidatus Limnocylindria bacterium]|nr:CDGSH iron-sulfur domain-containing protein [Candidatus Limnocylindria bacterium]
MSAERAAPLSPREGPYEIEEPPGPVAWCSCGRSRYQPYCDGSHGDSGYDPVIVEIAQPGLVRWCGCKRTTTPPFCDGLACAPSLAGSTGL